MNEWLFSFSACVHFQGGKLVNGGNQGRGEIYPGKRGVVGGGPALKVKLSVY